MKMGILGAGGIAGTMAATIAQMAVSYTHLCLPNLPSPISKIDFIFVPLFFFRVIPR